MKDGADIALPDSGVPVELDRIYASIRDLAEALGPNGVNKDGTLNHLLEAGANALDGQGQRGNEMIRQLSAAAATFGEGAGPLFDTVTELAQFTDTLATNDKLVRAFVRDLAGVSASLVSERAEIQKALAGRGRLGGHGEDVRAGQPAGAGHRRREAHEADEDHQLRARQHRHRPRGRPGGDQQPDPRLQRRVRAPSARGSASRASCGTPTASSARSSSSPRCRR